MPRRILVRPFADQTRPPVGGTSIAAPLPSLGAVQPSRHRHPFRLRLITSNLGTPVLQQATADLMAAHDIGKGGARLFNFRDNPELLLQRPMAATLDASDDLHPNIRLGSLGRSYKRR
jgi:hypothetical protein